ncbi:hypothetical protein PVK06_035955 [Gossypium arboreum]|uniref:Uncharacterized protein n=1 Tax=Gossypium arboreum TaxID=29729 RepID=A0ABR0NIR3_GOSAR|nr:hypothetical protein PVK06_035955 [Gossypium arboreum]
MTSDPDFTYPLGAVMNFWTSLCKVKLLPKMKFFLWKCGWKALTIRSLISQGPLRGFLQQILTSADEFTTHSLVVKKLHIPEFISVAWKPPPQGWAKLNMDGSFVGNLGKAGVDAIIHDYHGSWLISSFWHIPRALSVEAELWAMRDGLILA